jgi:hypothetical protein
MAEAFKTACTLIGPRPTGLSMNDRGANLQLSPSWFLSAAPQGRSCGRRNQAPWL